jgi:hypothetical protein
MTKDKNNNIVEVVKQKRGRKPKKVIESVIDEPAYGIDVQNNITSEVELNESCENIPDLEPPKPGGKKRGRKPKGGKIIQQVVPLNNNNETKPNIILHLKCSLKDLQTNMFTNSNVECFNFVGKNDLNYEIINSTDETRPISTVKKSSDDIRDILHCPSNNIIDNCDYEYKNNENDIKDVWKKLKLLQHNLHINNISDKKADCFWCNCEFDNPPIYIPKHFIKNSYHVYGCFCTPECATAFLMKEDIDSSSKFERYYLLNHVYAKIYDYTKNIKPAPNPYYFLDKYYGNLSIQEYRSLLRNDKLFLIVDKPLTRILPELHEDNDDFIINNKIIPGNTDFLKKKMQKKQTKNVILTENFGLN